MSEDLEVLTTMSEDLEVPTTMSEDLEVPTTMSGDIEQAQMVQIIEIENDAKIEGKITHIFHADRLEKIMAAKKDLKKFAAISIIGRKRNGKSFLTNFLICHLRHLEKNPMDKSTEWLNKEVQITGVEWKQKRVAVTKGIWMWSEPFVLKNGKEEFGVLLLDCQGLYDPDVPSAKITDTLITLFALELSNIHIVNVLRDILSTDLEHLETSISFANISKLESKRKEMFDTLIVVHRDWQEEEGYGRHPDFFAHLEAKRKLQPGEKLVQEAFTRCIEFMLPLPGRAIRHGSAEDKPLMSVLMEDEDSRMFLEWATRLGHHLFLELPNSKKPVFTGKDDIMGTIKKLKKHYANGANIPRFYSPTDVLVHGAVMGVLHHLESTLHPELLSSIKVSSTKTKQQISKLVKDALDKGMKYIAEREHEINADGVLAEELWRFVREGVHTMCNDVEKYKLRLFTEHKADLDEIEWKTAGGVVVVTLATGAVCIFTGGLGLVPLLAIEAGSTAAVVTTGGVAAAVAGICGTGSGIAIYDYLSSLVRHREE